MDLVPEGFKDVLENNRDHDSTKVAEILQVFSEAKEAILLPEHCLRSPDRVFQTSQLDVACFSPRFAPRSSPGIYPRKRDKAARSARPHQSVCQSFRARDHKKRICQRSPTTSPSRKVICLVQIASMEQELHVSPDPPIPTDPYLFL